MSVLGVITLAGEERSAGRARRFARDVLGPGHPDLYDVQTCASEMVSNAVRHTASGRGGKITLALLDRDGGITVEVTDDGADGARPYVQDDLGGETGRGMQVIDGLARRWGFRPSGSRTTVWAQFPERPVGGARPDAPSGVGTADRPVPRSGEALGPHRGGL